MCARVFKCACVASARKDTRICKKERERERALTRLYVSPHLCLQGLRQSFATGLNIIKLLVLGAADHTLHPLIITGVEHHGPTSLLTSTSFAPLLLTGLGNITAIRALNDTADHTQMSPDAQSNTDMMMYCAGTQSHRLGHTNEDT